MGMNRIVVVGASAAGISAAETLREEGFAGEIVMVGGELHAAYDRPPLSKGVLLGKITAGQVSLRPAESLAALNIEVRGGVRATGLDTAGKTLSLDTGETLCWDGLIIATGLSPRPLPGQPAWKGIHMLRTLDDALALREELLDARRVVVIGAGFLGCEIAATTRQMGLDVTLVDPLELPMLRQVGREVATAILQLQEAHGVQVRCGTGVAGFTGSADGVTGVSLSDGVHLDADVVVVAIGSIPATGWLQGSGLALDNGVMCDEFCCAAEGVYAAGDVANWLHPGLGTRLRLEHRMNATEQGMAAAQNLLGARVPFEPVPYFWTDLFDVKIQGLGRIDPACAMTVLSGRPGEAGFTAAFTRGGLITAVLGWNAPREFRKIRGLVNASVNSLLPLPTPV
ncbi:MAG: NAD(P)/FAD-dependent oxidoreductase [Variovorax sp.]|nr:MAG: NAD(P)/FAD-dependent oxidoreductase [Variovorax sp.]